MSGQGGTTSQVRMGGIPFPGQEVGFPILPNWGYSLLRSGQRGSPSFPMGGTPFPGQDMGVPHPRSGLDGVPLLLGLDGAPHPGSDWMGYPPS